MRREIFCDQFHALSKFSVKVKMLLQTFSDGRRTWRKIIFYDLVKVINKAVVTWEINSKNDREIKLPLSSQDRVLISEKGRILIICNNPLILNLQAEQSETTRERSNKEQVAQSPWNFDKRFNETIRSFCSSFNPVPQFTWR